MSRCHRGESAQRRGHPRRRAGPVASAAGTSLRCGSATGRCWQIALDAAGDCPIVVVGPPRDLPVGVLATTEDPPGGGPAAGVAAGVAALPPLPAGALIAVLAADLPGVNRPTLQRLAAAVDRVDRRSRREPADGAVLVDAAGHRQSLIGVWRADRLAAAIALRRHWHGAPLHALLVRADGRWKFPVSTGRPTTSIPPTTGGGGSLDGGRTGTAADPVAGVLS